MYVVNKGQFSSWMTLVAYYTTLAIIIVFNTMINNNKNYKTAKTWIGIFLIIIISKIFTENYKYVD